VRALKDLQIPDHVGDHEADQNDAADRHHDLLPDLAAPQGHHAIADGCPSRHRVTVTLARRRKFFLLSMSTSVARTEPLLIRCPEKPKSATPPATHSQFLFSVPGRPITYTQPPLSATLHTGCRPLSCRPVADDSHRPLRMPGHELRYAAQQQPLDSAPSVRAQHDFVRTPLRRRVDDFLPHIPFTN